ncbi:hypothetical protein CGCSCA4_v005830 [Colletotrichum siamense]|uniref:Uncharacterized protein n=1 Tax=Colletotrichum siamense TaxID=690259 RepID=A0A9P5K3W6_COLSI|nr:hypothetical protein CGCSCA4_v005830 [Colletotrichum siamense]KAF4856649.1 hypothetical protein CGCSCA2_v008496 [Colletotrichum siamense]
MVSSVIHLDPFSLRHTKTSLSVTVASNFSLWSLFEDFAVSDPDELLAGLEDGRINLSKAPICRLHIAILEEEPIEDISTPSLVNDVACFIQACSESLHDTEDLPETQDSGIGLEALEESSISAIACEDHDDEPILAPAAPTAENLHFDGADGQGEVTRYLDAIQGLVEASLFTLISGPKAMAGFRTITKMTSPSLSLLMPQVLNTKHLSAIAVQSRLLPILTPTLVDAQRMHTGSTEIIAPSDSDELSSRSRDLLDSDVREVARKLWGLANSKTTVPPPVRQRRRAVPQGSFGYTEAVFAATAVETLSDDENNVEDFMDDDLDQTFAMVSEEELLAWEAPLSPHRYVEGLETGRFDSDCGYQLSDFGEDENPSQPRSQVASPSWEMEVDFPDGDREGWADDLGRPARFYDTAADEWPDLWSADGLDEDTVSDFGNMDDEAVEHSICGEASPALSDTETGEELESDGAGKEEYWLIGNDDRVRHDYEEFDLDAAEEDDSHCNNQRYTELIPPWEDAWHGYENRSVEGEGRGMELYSPESRCEDPENGFLRDPSADGSWRHDAGFESDEGYSESVLYPQHIWPEDVMLAEEEPHFLENG